MKSLQFILAAVLVCCASAAYPTEFPFENEALAVSAPLASTPSRTFDEADTGGYVYTYAYALETYDLDGTFSSATSGKIDYRLVVHQGLGAGELGSIIPKTIFNCTNRYITKEWVLPTGTAWLGEIAGITICNPGECCESHWGLVSYRIGEPKTQNYDFMSDAHTVGLCGDMFDENVYCARFDLGLMDCADQYISHTDRLVTQACYDSYFHYMQGCKVYVSSGFPSSENWEPAEYFENSSAGELSAWTAVWWMPDKVCHPYSYYHPEAAKAVDAKDVDAETIESVCGECGNSCSDGLPANCDDLAKLLENGSDLATLTAKGECAASCSDECVALITDAFGSCKSISSTSSKSSTSGAALNGAIAVAAVAVLLL